MHFWSHSFKENLPISPSKQPHILLHPTVTSYNFSLSISSRWSLISKRVFKDGDGLFSLSSVVIAEVEHINHTFVFHLTETLLRKMEISSWQCVGALFLFQAVLFSWFYPPPTSPPTAAPATSVVWFEKGETEGGRKCVWCKRELNFLCCWESNLQLCVKLHHISPDYLESGLQDARRCALCSAKLSLSLSKMMKLH